jgi:hypothetical protein
VDKSTFDDYITRFNAQDDTAFDDYFADDFRCLNGALEIAGIDAWKQHYATIWSTFKEELLVDRWIGDEETVAIRMRTHFTARHDDAGSLFGPVEEGHTFDFYGVIMYELTGGRFSRIQVAYNSFSSTSPDGERRELGIPH